MYEWEPKTGMYKIKCDGRDAHVIIINFAMPIVHVLIAIAGSVILNMACMVVIAFDSHRSSSCYNK